MRRAGVCVVATILLISLTLWTTVSASVGWTGLPSPNLVVPYGTLEAVSCFAPTACEAVGGPVVRSGARVLFGEGWNGTSWSAQSIPVPLGAADVGLAAISCSSAAICMAVGSYSLNGSDYLTLAEAWNGTKWSSQPTPTPSGATDGHLSGISCTAANQCTSVGYYYDGSAYLTLAEAWNGIGWTIQPTPSPSGFNPLNLSGISCTAANQCIAVGSYSDGSNTLTLAEAWDGTSWTIQSSPNPSGATNSYLNGISCTGATSCIAVGSYDNGTLAEQWDGTSWAIQPTPNPPMNATLNGISCPTSSQCEAVGSYFNGFTNLALTEVWNGSTWTTQNNPIPTGAVVFWLFGISCPATNWCTSVGIYSAGPFVTNLAEIWNGVSWRVLPPFGAPGEVDSGLVSVSCTATSVCVAVGGTNLRRGSLGNEGMMLAETWNGTKWSLKLPTFPKGARSGGLSGVSCSTATLCRAVGRYTNRLGSLTRTLGEAWNGTTWNVQATPNPPGATFSDLTSISCPTANICMAVGRYNDSLGNTLTLAEAWNGTSWSIQPSPNPPEATSSTLAAVSCTAPTNCTAVGSYNDSLGNPLTLAEAWNGINWSIQPSPNPSGATYSSLTGTSCSDTTNCTAVGTYYDNSGTSLSLAETWNGTVWSIQPTPNPSGSTGSSFGAVACFAVTACHAVGTYYDSSGNALTLAELWNGVSWNIETTPARTGITSLFLSGVSCPVATHCMAVGDYFYVTERTLSESWSG